jgi:hypothetical protein
MLAEMVNVPAERMQIFLQDTALREGRLMESGGGMRFAHALRSSDGPSVSAMARGAICTLAAFVGRAKRECNGRSPGVLTVHGPSVNAMAGLRVS